MNNRLDSPSQSFMMDEITIILVCPSIHKQCGIGRYCHHVHYAVKGIVKSAHLCTDLGEAETIVAATVGPCVVLFQHEYSLLDFSSHLSESETTADLISGMGKIASYGARCRVALIMHTLVPYHVHYDYVNRLILSAQFPIFSTNREGARHFKVNYLELGTPREQVRAVKAQWLPAAAPVEADDAAALADPPRRRLRVGSFGFLTPNKDVNLIFKLCAEADCDIRANFAAKDKKLISDVRAQAKKNNVFGRITFDFLTEEELIAMLDTCDIIYLPQHDLGHYSTSATARLPLALGKVVVTPSVRPFHDLSSVVKFVDADHVAGFLKELATDTDQLHKIQEAARMFSEETSMGQVYSDACQRLWNYQVWCGGAIADNSKIVTLDEMVVETQAITLQNAWGFKVTGQGVHEGAVKYLDGKPVGEESLTLAVKNPVTRNAVVRTRLAYASSVSEATSASLPDKAELALQVAAFAGDRSHYLSVLEFLELPVFCQQYILVKEFGVMEDVVLDYLHAHSEASIFTSTLSGPGVVKVVEMLVKLRSLTEKVPMSRHRLIWDDPRGSIAAGRRQILVPAALLLASDENFVKRVYEFVLHRPADPDGLAGWIEALGDIGSKSEVAWLIYQSVEAQDKGVELAYSLNDWKFRERVVQAYSSLIQALAPSARKVQTSNFHELYRRYEADQTQSGEQRRQGTRESYVRERQGRRN